MIDALRNRRVYRPRNIIRRRASRPVPDKSKTSELRLTQEEVKHWLSTFEPPYLDEEYMRISGKSAIFHVTLGVCSSEIARILAETPDMNIKDRSGYTPLHWACINNNYEAVRQFMTRQPDLYMRNNTGDTALHLASATENINPKIIHKLLVKKKCLNSQNTNGLTPLHVATINNNLGLMTIYLDYGAETDVFDNENGWTPLHHAAMARHSKAALLLLRRNANPNMADQYGQTPLFNAVMGGDLGMVTDFVVHNANIYVCDNFGQTPIHLAARNTTSSILSWFLTHWYVNINCQNYRGQTLLHCALEDSRYENVKAILQREPDLEIRDEKGFTPLDLHHHIELIKHVIKVKVAKLPVSKRTLDIAYALKDSEFIEKHELSCYEELELMKKTLFPGLNISYYQLTFAGEQRRAEYMMYQRLSLNNQETCSQQVTIQNLFPIYWGTIERRFVKGRDRSELLEKLENEKYRMFGCLPDHCVSNILSYLSIEDINELLKVL